MDETDREPIVITLTGDEALVLFEWVARFNDARGVEFEDQAEERVLWDLESRLESMLVAPLTPEYDQRLAAARARVRDHVEP
jgi:hypothetical protein